MSLSLGIDIGTSKIALNLLNRISKESIFVSSCLTEVANLTNRPEGFREQSPDKIFSLLINLLQQIPEKFKSEISTIGITGQMHGVSIWNDSLTSPLHITWQDHRSSNEFLQKLKSTSTHTTLSHGFGVVSLCWLQSFQAHYLTDFPLAGTIMDFIAAKFLGKAQLAMHASNAASFGCFDIHANSWDRAALSSLGLPENLLPEVVPDCPSLGTLQQEIAKLTGIAETCEVFIPIGDNQASLIGSLERPFEEIAITIGTGAQISAVVAKIPAAIPATAEVRPYRNGDYLLVAAPLCGGYAYSILNRFFQHIVKTITGAEVSKELIYELMEAHGSAVADDRVSFTPRFFGERYAPEERAKIEGLSEETFSFAHLSSAAATGVVKNLKEMFPSEILQGRSRIVGSGNGIRRSAIMRKQIEVVFGLPLILTDVTEEAARGAALLGC